MPVKKSKPIKMPELLVFFRMLCIGFVAAEVFLLTYLGSLPFGRMLNDGAWFAWIVSIVCVSTICVAAYTYKRGGYHELRRVSEIGRGDFLMFVLLGYVGSMIGGQRIYFSYGFPNGWGKCGVDDRVGSISSMVNMSGFDPLPIVWGSMQTKFAPSGAPDSTNCQVIYTNTGTGPVITTVTTGC